MTPKRQENLSKKITSWIAQITPRDIPRAVQETAKEHLLDGFATMLAGAKELASRRIDQHLRTLRSKPQSTVVGTSEKFAAQYAALANGVRGHVLDYDDAQLSSLPSRPFGQLTHPTTPVLAAALALAESIQTSGLNLLTAYIVGVEIACRLADAIDPRHYLNGFHATGTLGTFGAAAACAHLLKLDERRIGWALGIAGSVAAGVRAQRGTFAKSLNAGRAAENGVLAVLLAKTGFTASNNIFDDPMGFVSAACYGKIQRKLVTPGNPFFFAHPGISIKIYPCAAVMHPALDAIIELAENHNIQPAEVSKIRVNLGLDAALPLVYKHPRSALEGKFSLPFSAALAIVHRKAGVAEYSDQQLRNPKVTRLMKITELEPIAQLKSKGNLGAEARVEIRLKNGRAYRGSATIARGHPQKPISRSDLEEKFRSCGDRVIAPSKAEAFLERLWGLEQIPRVGPWIRLLATSKR